jgi:hypothetical protein
MTKSSIVTGGQKLAGWLLSSDPRLSPVAKSEPLSIIQNPLTRLFDLISIRSPRATLDRSQPASVIMTVMSVWTPLISAAGSLGGALVGAFVGGWLSDRREQKKRSADLIVRQLQEFYGPLTALRAETHLYDDLITRMNSGAPDQMPISGDDLTIMKEKLFPIYQRMITVFRTNMSVGGPTAHEYFYSLCKYVDSWEKSLHSASPAHAWIVRGQNDEVLQPFYAHLQRFHDKLLADYKAM